MFPFHINKVENILFVWIKPQQVSLSDTHILMTTLPPPHSPLNKTFANCQPPLNLLPPTNDQGSTHTTPDSQTPPLDPTRKILHKLKENKRWFTLTLMCVGYFGLAFTVLDSALRIKFICRFRVPTCLFNAGDLWRWFLDLMVIRVEAVAVGGGHGGSSCGGCWRA